MHGLLYKLRQAVRFHGLRGAVYLTCKRAAQRVVFTESHMWFELDPAGERPRPPLPSGLSLRRGTESDLPLLAQMDTVSPAEGLDRIRDGNDLWLALEGEDPLFSCWIFRGDTPAIAAPGGRLPLPDGVVCQEDSVTAMAARGRGIAPAAWAAIADALAAEGQRRLIRKVEVANAPSRRAGEKVGFRPIALMHFRRRGPLKRTSVEAFDTELGALLAERLETQATHRRGSG
jgi:hypothetical protein